MNKPHTQLTNTSDALVIGGGIIGMLTALELHRRGASVSIIEKNLTGKESSWAGGGILSPLYPWRYDDAVSALAKWSQSIYPKLTDELNNTTGIDPQWTQSGMIISDVPDEEEQQGMTRWSEKFSARIQRLQGSDIKHIQPGLDPALDQAIYLPEVAQVRNPRFVKALKQSLLSAGVNIIESSEVTQLLTEKNKALGVVTPDKRYFADDIIIASGAWSMSLLDKTNLPERANLHELKPVRGQMLLIKARPGLLTRIVLDHNRYLIPRRDGRILVGSTLEDVGFDKSTTQTARESLWQSAIHILPELARFDIEHQWAGLRPGSKHGIPVISAHPDITGLYINSGHYRNGVVLGPASARLLVDIIEKDCTILDPAPYRI